MIYSEAQEKSLLEKDYISTAGLGSEAAFSKSFQLDDLWGIRHWISKLKYQKWARNFKESILDFEGTDTTKIKGSAIYMYCDVESPKAQAGYLMSRSTDGLKVWVNGKEVYKTVPFRGFEQYFSDYSTIRLRKGTNKLLFKRIIGGPESYMEVKIADRVTALKEYKKSSEGIVLSNALVTDTVKLKDNHADAFKAAVLYTIRNIKGAAIYSTTKYPSSKTFILTPILKDGNAYTCSFQLGSEIIRQPFFKGNPDEYLRKTNERKTTFPTKVKTDIEPYLYRLDKLLKHESRKTDWWWSFKIADVIYETENIINNFKDENRENLTFGIRFKSFTSELDGSVQHYLLITPDSLKTRKATPLVLVIRPFIENQQHFLTSPQMSRYWGLLWAKNLANKYHYMVLMPAARLYTNEPMTPMSEAEIFEAINDLDKDHPIDRERIYLQGNCSAGYRSIMLAAHHPSFFAAIGLYAPVIHIPGDNRWIAANSPDSLIGRIPHIPMILHYDSLDLHNPYSEFADFIKTSLSNGNSLTVSNSRHSGLHYNVQLVGEETLRFFWGKQKKGATTLESAWNDHSVKSTNLPVIADFFSEPFLFIINHYDKNQHIKTFNAADSLIAEYKSLLYSNCPVKYDDEVTAEELKNKNLFFVGHTFDNAAIKKKLAEIPLTILKNGITLHGKEIKGRNITFETLLKNPFNPDKKIIIFSTNSDSDLEYTIPAPWKNGFEEKQIIF